MAMPRKLKLMNVFLNGYSYQGVAKSVTLPKLTRKLENYRGAGMNGSAPVDLGLDDDALSMEWSLGGFPDSVIWELYAATGVDAVPIRFAGSYQRDLFDNLFTTLDRIVQGNHIFFVHGFLTSESGLTGQPG